MHIVLLVLGVLAGLGFWWYRLQQAGNAASEVVDTLGRARGAMRRKKIRRQTELSPLTAIDDPVVAAATLLVALVTDEVALSPEREQAVAEKIGALTSREKADEALVYGKWANSQVDDTSTTISKVAPFLAGRLSEAEKHTMVDMARAVVSVEGPALPAASQNIRRLTQKLGIEVH